MHQRAGGYPAPPGSPPDIPGLEFAGEVVGRGPGAERFEEGDRVMAVVGGGGQAELATVHERAAMPVPDGARLAGGRRPSGGLHDRSRRDLHPGRAAPGRAPARPRRRRRRGHGGRPARARGWAPRSTATVRREELRPGVEGLGATAIDPEGFEDAGPFDVILELVGAPEPAGEPQGARHRRPDRRDRRGRRVQGGAQPAGPDGQARPHPRRRPCARARSRRRRSRPRGSSSARCCRCSSRAR